VVTMSRNMLPFEWREARRFGWSWMTLKMLLLRITQLRTFRRADSIIFLTRYARESVMQVINGTVGKTTIIPHGIDNRFFCPPRKQLPIKSYSHDRPFRMLYVSIIDVYKHQWRVARAVWRLRQKGLPVVIDFVGSANARALGLLMRIKKELDPFEDFIFYRGPVPFDDLHTLYHHADAFVFASSCENMPNILLEAMASGLPIACSNRGPMPEVLGENGVYFDPEIEEEIIDAMGKLVGGENLRDQVAHGAFLRARQFSWHRCADETLAFIAATVKTKKLT